MPSRRAVPAAPGLTVGAAIAVAWVFLLGAANAQTPSGTAISNQARVTYVGASGVEATTLSNRVDVTTAVERTPARISLTRIVSAGGEFSGAPGPAACVAGGEVVALGAPAAVGGAELALDRVYSFAPTAAFHGGEALFAHVEDRDQNLDAAERDDVLVTFESPTGDSERIRLTETAADSGVFAGYVPSRAAAAAAGDCVLQVARNASFEVRYVDPADPTDRATAEAAVDPVSRVFDAMSGRTVDGARVTLVHAATGRPAAPLGDDGTSAYPATVESGARVSDAGGASYALAPGEFRFPVVPPGDYRLLIEPPRGYAAPSRRSEPELQALSGAPFVLGQGSFGRVFGVGPAPVMNLDVPVDPAMGTLYLDKRTTTTTAAVGDFVEYRLSLTHSGGLEAAEGVVIEDRLPPGLKFLPGSARIGDAAMPIEPEVGADGRVLRFALGPLAPDAGTSLRYVTAVVPGAAGRELVNVAEAYATHGQSNPARASVRLVDDLFTGESFLAGRVTLGACTDPRLGESTGLAGVRLVLEDGRYAISDEGGRFHFEGLVPGAHVLQLDVDSLPGDLEIAACDTDSRFAGTAFSRFVTLQPGALGRADFRVRRVPPPRGDVTLVLEQSVEDAAAVPGVDYRLTLGTDAKITTAALQAMIMLPAGLSYVPGSAAGAGGQPLEARVHGEVITLDLGTRQGPWREVVRLRAALSPDAAGDLEARALARFEFDGRSAQTPPARTVAHVTPGLEVGREYVLALNFATLSADLTAADRAELDALIPDWRGIADVRVAATGHSDSVPISPRSRALYADNYALSEARARAVAEYLGAALTLDSARLSVRGLGPDRPLADDSTAEGRRRNRRVELTITGVATARDRALSARVAASPPRTVTVEAAPGPLPDMTVGAGLDRPVRDNGQQVPEYDLIALGRGTQWLWPAEGFSPPIPTTKVAIKHGPDQRVELSLNGVPVSALNFDGVEVAAELGVALSRWRGIDLEDGPNTFTARVVAVGDRGTMSELTRSVHFAGPPVRGELVAAESVLVADGKTRPSIALKFVDRWGRAARTGAATKFTVEPPYRSWWDFERLRENPVLMSGDRSPTLSVDSGGLARLELAPTATAGQVAFTVRYANDSEQSFRAWLEPVARDWILVGLAQGTLGHRRVAGNMERAAAADLDDDYYEDGRLAFYAKGRIKGSLLTLALDSDGERDDPLDALGGTIDPDRYYTLYGDNTEQRFDAASRERLYVKVERDTFMAMAGDYETGLTVTELGRYSRSLTGLKSERRGQRVSYSAFAAATDQSFVRDELSGNGTSGPYALSRRALLAGSDKLAIEIRDRFRPERVITSRGLQRHFDYDIDYATGTIYFREPIANRDLNFDPVYIVAEYETSDPSDEALVAGGRGAVHFGRDSEAGLTLVREGTVGAPGELVAADLRYRFNAETELEAEIAATDTAAPASGPARGTAYRLALSHQAGRRQLSAYVDETEAGFGLGQQPATDAGTRRAGVALRNEIGAAWLVETELFRQLNLLAGNERAVLEAQTRYQDTRRTGTVGLRHVDERIGDEQRNATQGFAGGTWRFFDEVLTTRVNLESELGGDGAGVDYPTRALLGLDVAVTGNVSLFGEHEVATGAELDTQMTRVGIKATPIRGSQIETALNEAMTEHGPRSYASLGLMQGFNLGERWTLDVGLERSETLASPAAEAFDERVPLASGSLAEEFSTGFLGLGFRAEHWSFTQRFEHRDSTLESQRSLVSGFYRERNQGRGFSAELRLLERGGDAGLATFDGSLRLGFAYRPADSRWMLFDRADWRSERRRSGEDAARTERLVNNFNAHFAINARQELAIQHGLKHVRARFDDYGARGFVNLVGFDWRRQINPKLDAGVHGSWYRAVELDTAERGWGIDLGIRMARNFMLSVGYNFEGFEDDDFSAARYTARGPYVQFRLKVDQASLKDLLGR